MNPHPALGQHVTQRRGIPAKQPSRIQCTTKDWRTLATTLAIGLLQLLAAVVQLHFTKGVRSSLEAGAIVVSEPETIGRAGQ
jgi:hypothetical protein